MFGTLLRRRDRHDRAATPPRAGEGELVYAVGDVHGEDGLLRRMEAAILADAAAQGAGLRRRVILLGDYVDRGPGTRAVLEHLSGDAFPGLDRTSLRGNHDQMLLDFVADPVANAWWLEFGGTQTLGSYGIRASVGASDPTRLVGLRDALLAAMPPAHLAFLRSLPLRAESGGYAFVHAGIRPRRPLDAQAADDLLAIREPFLSHPGPHERLVVHGHTVVAAPERHPCRIAVDTGAYMTGILSAAVLKGPEVRFLSVRARP